MAAEAPKFWGRQGRKNGIKGVSPSKNNQFLAHLLAAYGEFYYFSLFFFPFLYFSLPFFSLFGILGGCPPTKNFRGDTTAPHSLAVHITCHSLDTFITLRPTCWMAAFSATSMHAVHLVLIANLAFDCYCVLLIIEQLWTIINLSKKQSRSYFMLMHFTVLSIGQLLG